LHVVIVVLIANCLWEESALVEVVFSVAGIDLESPDANYRSRVVFWFVLFWGTYLYRIERYQLSAVSAVEPGRCLD